MVDNPFEPILKSNNNREYYDIPEDNEHLYRYDESELYATKIYYYLDNNLTEWYNDPQDLCNQIYDKIKKDQYSDSELGRFFYTYKKILMFVNPPSETNIYKKALDFLNYIGEFLNDSNNFVNVNQYTVSELSKGQKLLITPNEGAERKKHILMARMLRKIHRWFITETFKDDAIQTNIRSIPLIDRLFYNNIFVKVILYQNETLYTKLITMFDIGSKYPLIIEKTKGLNDNLIINNDMIVPGKSYILKSTSPTTNKDEITFSIYNQKTPATSNKFLKGQPYEYYNIIDETTYVGEITLTDANISESIKPPNVDTTRFFTDFKEVQAKYNEICELFKISILFEKKSPFDMYFPNDCNTEMKYYRIVDGRIDVYNSGLEKRKGGRRLTTKRRHTNRRRTKRQHTNRRRTKRQHSNRRHTKRRRSSRA
jgi:hypothetical protein